MTETNVLGVTDMWVTQKSGSLAVHVDVSGITYWDSDAMLEHIGKAFGESALWKLRQMACEATGHRWGAHVRYGQICSRCALVESGKPDQAYRQLGARLPEEPR